MKKLVADLGLQFVNHTGQEIVEAGSIQTADGVVFSCPECGSAHKIICWTEKVPMNLRPRPGRWILSGEGAKDLTLKGAKGHTSLLHVGMDGSRKCVWSGQIRDGVLEILPVRPVKK